MATSIAIRQFQVSLLVLLIGGGVFFWTTAQNAAYVYEKEIKKKAGAIDSIKSEIDKRRIKIRELEKTEGSFLARLDYLESNIEASKQYLLMLSNRIDTAETTIVRLTDSLHLASMLLADRQTVMQERLRRAYMTGMASPLMVLLMSQNPLDLVHRAKYLEEVHRYDRDLLGRIDHTRQTIGEKKQSFETERAKLAALLFAKKKEQLMLLKEETSRRAILSDIRVKKKSNQAMIAELQESQRDLDRIIRVLEQKRVRSLNTQPAVPGSKAAFGLQKGRLPWPLRGRITANFGKIVHPLYQTVTMNNGIDIKADTGETVHCVATGTVIYTGSMRGLGRLVIVDHGGGFLTIYANLGEFAVTADQAVAAGAAMGKAGTGDTPQIHFEIRKSTDSLDPMLWLEKRK
jgi:murein hydrolase activator